MIILEEKITQTNDFIVTKFQSLTGILEGKNATYILETILLFHCFSQRPASTHSYRHSNRYDQADEQINLFSFHTLVMQVTQKK